MGIKKKKKISEAERMLDRAICSRNPVRIVDAYNEVGKEKRANDDVDGAIEAYRKGAEAAEEYKQALEGSFAERALAEMYAMKGDRERCLHHISRFQRLAKECNHVSQMQLSFHVKAWCLQHLYDSAGADKVDLERALSAASESLKMVRQFGMQLRKYEEHGTIEVRQAKLYLMMAQIEQMIGNEDEALRLLIDAELIVNKINDKDLEFEILLTKSGLSMKNQRIQIAREMVRIASNEKRGYALAELSHQLFLMDDLSTAYRRLMEAFIENSKHLHEDLENVEKRLIIMFKLNKYHEELKSARIPKCAGFESIADLYDEYFRSMSQKEQTENREFALDFIIGNYRQMIKHQRNVDDELRALLAMGLVYLDLDSISEAEKCFARRLKLAIENSKSPETIIDTRISIFSCHCKQFETDVEEEFEELLKQPLTEMNKKELFNIWSEYWRERNMEERAEEYRAQSELIESDEDAGENQSDVLFNRWSDEMILEAINEEHQEWKAEEALVKNKDKRDDKGETELHNAAKVDNAKDVERLCRLGYTVNVQDNAGWTPLAEAVAHENIENVRVLIKFGAKLDLASHEGFENRAATGRDHTKLTPLMEACANGFVEIANVLIEHGARIDLRDSCGWTPFNHLENYLNENGFTKEQKAFLIELERLMEERKVEKKAIGRRIDSSKMSAVLMENPTRITINNVTQHEEEEEDENDMQPIIPARKRRQPRSPLPNIAKRRVSNETPLVSKRTREPSEARRTPAPEPKRIAMRQQSPEVVEVRRSVGEKKQPPPNASLIVSVYFDDVKFGSKMWSMSRSCQIRDIREKIRQHIANEQMKIKIVKKENRMELSDEIILEQIGSEMIDVVAVLEAAVPLEVYEKRTDAISEVCERLKSLTTRQLDLSNLYLNANQLDQITSDLMGCEIGDELTLDLSRSCLTKISEMNLQTVLSKCQALILRCTKSSTSFRQLFSSSSYKLAEIEMSAQKLDANEILGLLLDKCERLEKLAFVSIQSPPGLTFKEQWRRLTVVDLSNNAWIGDDEWRMLLSSMEMVNKLSMNMIEAEIMFETSWLPKIREFAARGSCLEWTSVLDCLTTSDCLLIDLRRARMPAHLQEELRQGIDGAQVMV